MVGRQQPRLPGDDAMPIMVGVAGESDVEAILGGPIKLCIV
jgi:hypothetical protein